MEPAYRPIDCDEHDRLLALATLRRPVRCTVRCPDGQTAELAGIYAEIDRLEPVPRPQQAVRPRIERYPWPLGAAVVALLMAVALPRRSRA